MASIAQATSYIRSPKETLARVANIVTCHFLKEECLSAYITKKPDPKVTIDDSIENLIEKSDKLADNIIYLTDCKKLNDFTVARVSKIENIIKNYEQEKPEQFKQNTKIVHDTLKELSTFNTLNENKEADQYLKKIASLAKSVTTLVFELFEQILMHFDDVSSPPEGDVANVDPDMLASTTASAAASTTACNSEIPASTVKNDSDSVELSSSERLKLLEREHRYLKKRFKCKGCKKEAIGSILLPCGHIVLCVQCADDARVCPVDKKIISATANVYLS